MKILTINPGSTSTKIGLFENNQEVFVKTLRHDVSVILSFPNVVSQLDFRKQLISEALTEQKIEIAELDAIVGRGGLLRPIAGGAYAVNENMIADLKSARYGEHASNLGGLLAADLAGGKIPAFIVDPVVVDELIPEARISGHPMFHKKSIFHALNQKAIAKQYASEKGKKYEELNLIVTHLGGGISVGAHRKGQVIDVNNALGGEGPFSPERSGSLPINDLIEACYSGKYSKKQMLEISVGKGGMVGFFNSNSFADIMKNIDDPNTKLIIDGLVLQLAKEIGGAAAVLKGKVDAILLTGGLAYSQYLTDAVAGYVSYIAEVCVYPGEDELKALALGGAKVLSGEEQVRAY